MSQNKQIVVNNKIKLKQMIVFSKAFKHLDLVLCKNLSR